MDNKKRRDRMKSYAKAAGVKSVLVLPDGQRLMTSFGKGNEAVREKRIIGETVEDLQSPGAFFVEQLPGRYRIKGRRVVDRRGEHTPFADDPLAAGSRPGEENAPAEKKVRKDQIGAKDELEKRYFGQTFDDNVHIQLIYNILDIEKIMALHVNNIVYELNNVLHREQVGERAGYLDLIGNLGLQNEYACYFQGRSGEEKREAFQEFLKRPQLGYFGSAFYMTGTDTKAKIGKSERKNEEEIFYLLCLLGTTRNSLAHGTDGNRVSEGAKLPDVSIYTLEAQYDRLYNEGSQAARRCARDVLNYTYADRVNPLNKDFMKKAGKNLTILFRALDVKTLEDKTAMAREYYDFSVRKAYKNLGFSVKKIRELILEQPDASVMKGDSYNTVRSKLYGLFDFVIFDYYRSHDASAFIGSLRSVMTEDEKTALYTEEAKKLWQGISGIVMEHVLPFMKGTEIKSLDPDPDIRPSMLDGVMISTDASYFSKLIYLLTLFLDGKEINDLLTTLVHKFDSINSFLKLLEAEGLPREFTEDYKFFENCGSVTEELRTINSFARMQTPAASAKKAMFVEAATVLGAEGSREELEAYFDDLLGKDSGPRKPNGKKDNGLRNFIASNVIESSRFRYLIRYVGAENARRLGQNRAVVKFALSRLPEDQIVRYYNACFGVNRAYEPELTDKLADLITGMSFESIKTVKQNPGKDRNGVLEKQKKQAAISLYLTILYHIAKNLVYVNSRYFLAFHCVERDGSLFGFGKNNRLGMTDRALKKELLNRHADGYVRQNLANAEDKAVDAFRNQAEHLNAVRYADKYIADLRDFNSYFDIYHYVVQRSLMDDNNLRTQLNPDGMTLRYFAKVERYRTPCKDLIKALNVPFAYNLARYKNLSINGLFDRNYPGESETMEPEEKGERD